jgi:hypothetical protein
MRYHDNKLVEPALWMLRQFSGPSRAIAQLQCRDHIDPRQTFLYRLSQLEGVEWFKSVQLVASPQDRYVPYASAQLDMERAAIQDFSYGILSDV